MADWTNEANEYLDGYLKQVAVLVRQQGDDPEDVIAGLRDHILNEVESDGAETVTIERLLPVLTELGSPEEVASVDLATLKLASTAAPSVPPPAVPKVTKSVVVHRHRSPLSCVLAIILAGGALLFVLAVLSVLASILLPALARSREAARRTACQNNLKQFSLSLSELSAAQDGQLPPIDLNYTGVMFNIDEIFPSIASDFGIFTCPSGPNANLEVSKVESEYDFKHDYVYITHVIRNEREGLAYLNAVAEAKRTDTPLLDAIVFDDGTVLPRIEMGDSTSYDASPGGIPIMVERPGRHIPDGFNVLYLDGHVEYGRLDGQGNFPWTEAFAKAVDEANLGL